MSDGSASPAAPKGRDAGIDLLRGVAIGLVLLLHYSLTYRLSASPLAAPFGPGPVRALVVNGNYAVTMFFAVSGFLITDHTLRRSGGRLAGIDLRAFYVLRASRILPPLVLALTVIVALGCLGVPSFGNKVDGVAQPNAYFLIAAGSVLTFTHNLLMQSAGYFNYCLNIYWSLSVEEVFYLAFPLLCLALPRQGFVVLACLAAVAIGPIYRHAHADDEIRFMYAYPACFDAIALGVLAALAAARISLPKRWARAGAVLSALLLAAAYLRGIAGNETFGFTVVALCSATLLFCNASLRGPTAAGARAWAPLRWAGRHSYELYLFHIVVLAVLRDLLPRDLVGSALKLPLLALYLVLSAGLAAAVAKWLSVPAEQSLRRRFLAARASPGNARAVNASTPGVHLAGPQKELS